MNHREFGAGVVDHQARKISGLHMAGLVLLATFLFFTGISASADATNRFVTTGGADTGNCNSTTCASINYAIGQSVNGDVIFVGTGTFNGTSTLNKAVRIEGDGPGNTILSSAGVTATIATGADNAEIKGVTFQGGTSPIRTDVATSGVKLTNVEVTGASSYAIAIHNNGVITNWILDGVNSHHNLHGMRVRGQASGLQVKNSHFDNNTSHGFFVPENGGTFDNASFTDTTFNDNGDKAFYLERGTNISLLRVEANNTGGGTHLSPHAIEMNLKFGAAGGPVSVVDSEVDGSTGPGIVIRGQSPVTVGDVTLTGNSVSNTTLGVGFQGQVDLSDANVANNDFTENDYAIGNATSPSSSLDLGSGNTFDNNGSNVAGPVTDGPSGDLYVATTGSNSGNLCANSGSPCATIQHAIDVAAANDGNTIHLAAGTYTEQVIVNGKDLNFHGASKATTTIKSPNSLIVTHINPNSGGNVRGIFAAKNGGDVFVQDLTLDGDGKSDSNNVFVGFDAFDSDLSIDDVHVTNVRNNLANPVSGTQSGLSIYTQSSAPDAPNGTASLSVTDTQIDNFQKAGIVADRDGVTVNLTGNTITCVGPTANIAQNAIQVSRGANGTISGNTVSGCDYTNPGSSGAGILLFEVGGPTVVSNNNISDSNYGLNVTVFPSEPNAVVDINSNTFDSNDVGVNTSNPVPPGVQGNNDWS